MSLSFVPATYTTNPQQPRMRGGALTTTPYPQPAVSPPMANLNVSQIKANSFPATDFIIKTENGQPVSLFSLLDHSQKPAILFFYPKEGSFFCKKQVAAIQDAFGRTGMPLIGISCSAPLGQAQNTPQPPSFMQLQDTNGQLQKDYHIGKNWFVSDRVTLIVEPKTKKVYVAQTSPGWQSASNAHIQNAKAVLEQISPVKARL
jgi:peroxiredoxin